MVNASLAAEEDSACVWGVDPASAARAGSDRFAHEAMLAALESWGRAAVLIDQVKRVVCLNPSAQALIGDGVLISQHRLRASTRSSDAALQTLLSEAVAETASHRSIGLALPRRSGRPLIVHSAAAPGSSSRILRDAKAFVTLTQLERPTSAGAALLAQAYGLTPAEQTLCAHLSSGAALSEAAEAVGVSMNTVRTHLKSAFLKTGTHRQSELVALLGQAARSLWAAPEPQHAPRAPHRSRPAALVHSEHRAC